MSLHNSGNMPVSIETYMSELNLDVPDLLRGTRKIPTSSHQGSCCFAALAKHVPFQEKTPQQLRLDFQKYVISKGVKTLYSDVIFTLEIVSHSLGKLIIQSMIQWEVFVHSEYYNSFWISEVE